jgi:hypothetical protein
METANKGIDTNPMVLPHIMSIFSAVRILRLTAALRSTFISKLFVYCRTADFTKQA